jgi:hypothetical protein
MRRVSSGEVRSYHDIYTPIEPGALLTSSINGSVGQALILISPTKSSSFACESLRPFDQWET